LGFGHPFSRVGSDLLVYAYHSGGADYYTGICGGHKLAVGAKDFKELGLGQNPNPKHSK
jgi:hypothetical protein